MSLFELKQPELLIVEDSTGKHMVGCDQLWYPKKGYIPPGACGAATASNMLAYALRSRPDLYTTALQAGLDGLSGPLSDTVNKKQSFLEFMKLVYPFFLPRAGGLMSDDFVDGTAELSRRYGIPIEAERLLVSVSRAKRPSIKETTAFIQRSLEDDIPPAFLTLSTGSAENLENWHWVTIIAYDNETMKANIANNCVVAWTDISLWLDTSIMGGAFIRYYTEPFSEQLQERL